MKIEELGDVLITFESDFDFDTSPQANGGSGGAGGCGGSGGCGGGGGCSGGSGGSGGCGGGNTISEKPSTLN
ncbi:hypothetical protein [Pseudomonas syringae]|uniref:hypothetical protein n=1 Tax=Pseudomonas syringae TaxID=317 RepID=UPI00117B2D92|nr:hypothetical protein [Pseudomonas syringae]